jgi:hypothetical protein
MKKITRNLELESRALQMIKGSEKEMQRLGIELLKAYLNSYKKFKLFRNDHLHKKCGVDAKIQKELYNGAKQNEYKRRTSGIRQEDVFAKPAGGV